MASGRDQYQMIFKNTLEQLQHIDSRKRTPLPPTYRRTVETTGNGKRMVDPPCVSRPQPWGQPSNLPLRRAPAIDTEAEITTACTGNGGCFPRARLPGEKQLTIPYAEYRQCAPAESSCISFHEQGFHPASLHTGDKIPCSTWLPGCSESFPVNTVGKHKDT